MVEKKAYELYEKRGHQQGHEWQDWFEAEKFVEAQLCSEKKSKNKDYIRRN